MPDMLQAGVHNGLDTVGTGQTLLLLCTCTYVEVHTCYMTK